MKPYSLDSEHRVTVHKKRQIHAGDVFTRLTVISLAKPPSIRFLVCLCSCGTVAKIRRDGLLNGRSRSCGCLSRENAKIKSMRHGHAVDGEVSTEYSIWRGIKNRCMNKNRHDWHRYGGRGIAVCERWAECFQNFLDDMGLRPSKDHTIDRINNNGNYEPSNCRWATKDQQYGNRSSSRLLTWGGESLCLAQWERRLGLGQNVIRTRLRRGWSIEKALSTL